MKRIKYTWRSDMWYVPLVEERQIESNVCPQVVYYYLHCSRLSECIGYKAELMIKVQIAHRAFSLIANRIIHTWRWSALIETPSVNKNKQLYLVRRDYFLHVIFLRQRHDWNPDKTLTGVDKRYCSSIKCKSLVIKTYEHHWLFWIPHNVG